MGSGKGRFTADTAELLVVVLFQILFMGFAVLSYLGGDIARSFWCVVYFRA